MVDIRRVIYIGGVLVDVGGVLVLLLLVVILETGMDAVCMSHVGVHLERELVKELLSLNQ